MADWMTVSRKGKVRPPRGGGHRVDQRAGAGVGGADGNAGGATRPRTKLCPSDLKVNICDRPNTVVLDCHEFSVLPPDEELVHFIYEQVLKEEEDKEIFQQVESLFLMRMQGDS